MFGGGHWRFLYGLSSNIPPIFLNYINKTGVRWGNKINKTHFTLQIVCTIFSHFLQLSSCYLESHEVLPPELLIPSAADQQDSEGKILFIIFLLCKSKELLNISFHPHCSAAPAQTVVWSQIIFPITEHRNNSISLAENKRGEKCLSGRKADILAEGSSERMYVLYNYIFKD